uniref:Uncharacterized protein n=1 Tax=Anguilla anguilla TaxID=7936 RepID=A0A0E9VQL2_ANGAN
MPAALHSHEKHSWFSVSVLDNNILSTFFVGAFTTSCCIFRPVRALKYPL